MADILISMNKTTDRLWKYADEWEKTPEHFDGVNPFCVAIHAVRQITNASELPNEQKHGHWVFDPDGMDWNIPAWKCSECHCRNDNIPPNLEKKNPLRWSGSKFCPNCGAKMDEEVTQDG